MTLKNQPRCILTIKEYNSILERIINLSRRIHNEKNTPEKEIRTVAANIK